MTTSPIAPKMLDELSTVLMDGGTYAAKALMRLDRPDLAGIVGSLDLAGDPDPAAKVRAVHATVLSGPAHDGRDDVAGIVKLYADMIEDAAFEAPIPARERRLLQEAATKTWLHRVVNLAWVQGSAVRAGGVDKLAKDIRLAIQRSAPLPLEVYEAQRGRLHRLGWTYESNAEERIARAHVTVGGVTIVGRDAA